MEKLPVIFRAEKSGDHKGEVTAVFPTVDEGRGNVMCYAHIGQHGAASYDWYRTTRPATAEEYADLLAELRGIYTTRPAANPDIYGDPVELIVAKRWRS